MPLPGAGTVRRSRPLALAPRRRRLVVRPVGAPAAAAPRRPRQRRTGPRPRRTRRPRTPPRRRAGRARPAGRAPHRPDCGQGSNAVTDAELKLIADRLAAATPGPWEVGTYP